MRSAETILIVMRNRGQCGLQVKGLYRLLYNRNLYLCAYGKLYRNKGAMTEGAAPHHFIGSLKPRQNLGLTKNRINLFAIFLNYYCNLRESYPPPTKNII